jgi:hypothetical protein
VGDAFFILFSGLRATCCCDTEPAERARKKQKAEPELKTVFIASEMKFAMTESHCIGYNY